MTSRIAIVGIVVASTVVLAAQQRDAPSADPRIAWLQREAIRVRTVDPAGEDFSDLAPLKTVIGNARVVMLGEMGHGVGTTFLAKSRLVKFLHREMGFDVLAWESGFYDVPKAWQLIQGGENATVASRRAIFGVWSRAEEVQPLLGYIEAAARSRRPLEITGFDPQLSGTAAVDFLAADLATFLRRIGLPDDRLKAGAPFGTALIDMSAPRNYQVPNDAFLAELTALRQEVVNRLSEGTLNEDDVKSARYWIQMLRGVDSIARQMIRSERKITLQYTTGREMRTAQMGESLLWLLREQYRDRKVIVWSATSHVRYGDVASWGGTKIVTMGEVIREGLGPAVYTINFKPYDGTTGNPMWLPGSWPAADYRGELEELLQTAGFDQAFVDFRRPARGGEWLRQPLIVSRVQGREWRGLLPADQDAYFFIRTERPVTRAVK